MSTMTRGRYDQGPPLRRVDLLDHGECTRGHRIVDESQTVIYSDRLGRFCRACDGELSRDHDKDEPMPCLRCTLRTEEWAASARDEAIIDMIAVERRMNGDPCHLTQTEMRIACELLAGQGFHVPQIAATLHTSTGRVEELLHAPQ